jgi:hypothetical protein
MQQAGTRVAWQMKFTKISSILKRVLVKKEINSLILYLFFCSLNRSKANCKVGKSKIKKQNKHMHKTEDKTRQYFH